MVGAFGSKGFDNLLRNYVLPHKDSSIPSGDVPARVALPVAPPVAMGSSSAGVAADPPRAAAGSEAAAEPAAAGPEPPRAAPSSPSAPEPIGSPAPAAPRLSADEIAALVARGNAFLAAGDIASARLFFQRAADAGDGRAAMRMAVTFDAAFLDRAGVHGVRGDPEQAAFWYRRAQDLGEVKTERGTAPSTEPPSQLR
jgi:TPR repeat protein